MPDNTGKPFGLSPKVASNRNRAQAEKLFRNPRALACPECRSQDRFRIIADDYVGSELVQFVCSQCKTYWLPVELRKPQLDDYRAKALTGPSGHNLWLPDSTLVPIEIDIDMED